MSFTRVLPFCLSAAVAVGDVLDWRDLASGTVIVADKYLDQIYCVQWPGPPLTWVCSITRGGEGGEGTTAGEHVEVWRSADRGSSWTGGYVLEPTSNLTNSYSTLFLADSNRIYAMYNMNLDNVTALPDGSKPSHFGDELGHHVMKYSDDGGVTWSAQRYEVPMPVKPIDRANPWHGAVKMFWNVDQVKRGVDGTTAYYAFTKIEKPVGSPPEEVWVLASANLATAANASDVVWSMLPGGDTGVTPWKAGTVCEEGHIVPLFETPGFFLLFRTNVGYLGATATTDPTAAGGWAPAAPARFWSATPAATWPVKMPQSPLTLKRFSNGRYLLLFYFTADLSAAWPRSSRNPYWLAAGREEGGEVRFSQPEILFFEYADFIPGSFSEAGGYPDFIEDAAGGIFVTETNKTVARVHRLPPAFVAALFAQDVAATLTPSAALTFGPKSGGARFPTPPVPNFSRLAYQGEGASVALWLVNHSAASPGDVLLDTRVGGSGAGIMLRVVGASGALEFAVADATGANASLATDSGCTPLFTAPGGGPHYVAAVADAGAHKLLLYVDGALCDGGAERASPTAWLPFALGDATGAASFVLAPTYHGAVVGGGWWASTLSTSAIVSNYRAGV